VEVVDHASGASAPGVNDVVPETVGSAPFGSLLAADLGLRVNSR